MVLRMYLEGQLVKVDPTTCDLAQLQHLATNLYAEIAQIESQLQRRGSSLDWEERARRALSLRQGQLAVIEREQQRRQEQERDVARRFLQVAKERLPAPIFSALLRTARASCGEAA